MTAEDQANAVAECILDIRGADILTPAQRLRRRQIARKMASAGWKRSEIGKAFGMPLSNVNEMLAR